MKTEKIVRHGVISSSLAAFENWADAKDMARTHLTRERVKDGIKYRCLVPAGALAGHRFEKIIELPSDPGMKEALIKAFNGPAELQLWLSELNKTLTPSGTWETKDAEHSEQEREEAGGASEEASSQETGQEEGREEESGEALQVAEVDGGQEEGCEEAEARDDHQGEEARPVEGNEGFFEGSF